VRLQQVGDACFLEHRGTGEVHKLQGQWELLSQGDKAYLEPCGAGPDDRREAVWVNKRFDKSLHICPQGDVSALAVKSKASGTSEWSKGLHSTHLPLICKCEAVGGAPGFECAVWAYACVIDMHDGILFWEVPYVQRALLGNCKQGKWAMRHWHRWCTLLQGLGLSKTHLQKNHKALKAGAKVKSIGMPNSVFLQAVHEHCFSTQGLLIVLASLARPHRRSTKDIATAVLRVLGLIIGKFMGGSTCHTLPILQGGPLCDDDRLSCLLSVTDGFFCVQQLIDSRVLPKSFTKAFLRKCTAMQRATKQVSFALLLVELGRAAMNSRVHEQIKSALVSITGGVAGIIEIQRYEPVWTAAQPTCLPTLATKTRVRRISEHMRRFVMKKVTKDRDVKDAKQAVAGARMLATGSATEEGYDATLQGCSTKRWDWQEMFQYMCTTRMLFSRTRSLGISMDATRLAGGETLYLAVYSTATMQGSWLPAQVLRLDPTYPFHTYIAYVFQLCLVSDYQRLCLLLVL
jgi:hypothetical protein